MRDAISIALAGHPCSSSRQRSTQCVGFEPHCLRDITGKLAVSIDPVSLIAAVPNPIAPLS
jgi:hypothetical protein